MNEFEYMSRAIVLADRPLFSPHPNPRVGCVIVKNKIVVGEGCHEYAGGPHAEVNALKQAGDLAEQSTVFVTLEPCSHFGLTPPCADALIKARVGEVVIAMKDPNPKVAGQGIERLKKAGIKVKVGILEAQAVELNKGFIKRMLTGMPRVCSKIAMSLDGRTSMSSGESKWITGSQARQDVQKLRARTHAILSGSGTVLADNPRFTVRDASVPENCFRQPLRVIVDSKNKLNGSEHVFTESGKAIIAGINSSEHTDRLNCEYLKLPEEGGKVSLKSLLQALANRQINDVLVEAGPALNGALLSRGLIDELIVYMSTDVMGDDANGMFHLPDLKLMKDKVSFHCEDVRKVGKDIRMTLLPVY